MKVVVVSLFALLLATSSALAQTAPAAGDKAGWQRIHGHVQSRDGSKLTLKADDGRTLTVDMAQVHTNIQQALTTNEGVTVIGHTGAKPNEFTAQYIQQDSSAGRTGATAQAPAPTTPPATSPSTSAADQKAWQRIHGTVQSIQGTTLTLKADDGRTLTVDMAKVTSAVQKAITQGERVTVVGHLGGAQNHMTAEFIQQDKTGGAASPASK
jgi:outer membrane lipoprotein SlyB